jgi:retinol dehydrogenase 12
MGDLDSRHILITGATSGIGLATAIALAARGAHLWLANRSEERTRPVIESIAAATGNPDVRFVALDLGDLASVRRCASVVMAADDPLHVLINNAGVAGQRGFTASGFELAFGTNHVGHFLLTNLLLDRLIASAPSRVVTVSSGSHSSAAGIDWEAVRRPTAGFTGLREYGVSKLANLLFSQELSRRCHGSGLTTYALHPGTVASDIWKRVPPPFRFLLKLSMTSPAEGAETSLYCATSPEVTDQSGLYYDGCKVAEPSRTATAELAAELWQRSADWTESAS